MKCQQCGKDVRVPANCTGVVCRECKSSITVPIRIKPSNGMFLKSEWIDAELDGREVRMANIVNAPAVWLEIDGRSYVADLKPLLEALLVDVCEHGVVDGEEKVDR